MEYFGIKYAVKNNIIEVNTLATLTTLLILWDNSDSRLVLLWGMTLLNSSRSSYESITTAADLSDSLT